MKKTGCKLSASGWCMRIDSENWPRLLCRAAGRRGGTLLQLARIGRLLGEFGQTDPAMKDCEPQVREQRFISRICPAGSGIMCRPGC